MGDDITIGVTEVVNNIEVTAQPNDQIIDIDVIDNSDDVTVNITPNIIEVNINKGSSFARWGTIYGNILDQTDLQNALFNKADLVNGLVPAYQLPSFVDDVIEVANFASLPTTGETGKLYLTLDNNKIYRWGGSTYVEIASNQAIWGQITGTLSNQTDLQNALNLKADKTITITPNAPLTGGGNLSANRTISINQSGASSDGFLSSTDWNTFNNKQNQLNGTGFVKASGTTISYDNTSYLPLSGGTMTGDLFLRANNDVGGTNYCIGQTMASNDSWKIYGNTIALDRGELVFELGDNAFSSSSNGQRFRFHYENSSGGTAKSPFILDYNDATFNTNAYFSGKVGIGVIPKNWDSLYKVLQISDGALTGTIDGCSMSHNLWQDGETPTYITSRPASSYSQNSGNHYWDTAPSGTADNGMTLSTRMIITNGGNVGIGTTSPKTVTNGLSLTIGDGATQHQPYLALARTASGGYWGGIRWYDGNTIKSYIQEDSDFNLRFGTNNTERMRITSGGNVRIVGGGDLEIYPASGSSYTALYNDNDNLSIWNNGSERMRITSGGSVVVNNLGTGLVYSNAGALTSTNPSDKRLKDDITDLPYGLNEILQLRPVTYLWKNDTINQGKQFGFIAQEVQEIMPDLVKEFKTKDGEEDVIRLGLDKEAIFVAMVNAIKELKAEIDLLKQK